MNTKKLLALLCAAAMASSTLVPVISSAEETTTDATVLWSDTYDSYENTTYGNGGLTNVLTLAASVNGGEKYEGIPGATLYVSGRADDTSYYLTEPVEEGSTDLALKTSICRFSRQSGGSKMIFAETYDYGESEALVMSTKIKLYKSEDSGYNPYFKIGDVIITDTLLGVTDTWVELKIAHYVDGTYEVLVNDELKASGTTVSKSFDMNFSAIDAEGNAVTDASKSTTYHTIWVDDTVIYQTNDPFAAAPEAQTHTPEAIVTPSPTPLPESAPVIEATDGATVVYKADFNAATGYYSQGTESVKEEIDGIYFTIGGRSNGADSTTNVQVKENVAGDNVLAVANGRFGNSGREPKLYLTQNVNKSDLSGDGYAVMAFAAKLKPTDSYPAMITFFDEASSANIVTLTTADDATSGIKVPANEWISVEFIMYAGGEYGVSVNGSESPVTASLSKLPALKMHDGSANATYTSVDFDNFIVYVEGDYTATTPTPAPTIPPVAAAEGATVDLSLDMNSLDPTLAHYFGTAGTTYEDIEGIAYHIGGRADGANGDTTNVRVEKDTYDNQYLYAETSKYGANGRAPRFIMTSAPLLEQLATDDDYLAMSFATKLVPSGTNAATLVFLATDYFSTNGNYYVYNLATLTTAEGVEGAATVPANEWFVVDVKVKKTGDYEIYVDGTLAASGKEIASAGGGSDKVTLTTLPQITTNNGETATYAAFALDNLVIYHSGELSAIATPEPTATPAPIVAAPSIEVEGTVLATEDFNSLEPVTNKMTTESATYEIGSSLKVALGSRNNNGSTGESSSDIQYTAVSVSANGENDNVLKLTTGKFGTITRAPKVALVNSPVNSMVTGDDYIGMKFAVKLNKTNDAHASVLTFIANADDTVKLDENGENTNSETKDDGNVYGYSFGYLTIDEADETKGAYAVSANEWHVVEFVLYPDGVWYLDVDGQGALEGESPLKYSDSDKVAVTKLPQLVAGINTKDTKSYANVDIDNMVVYTSANASADVAITDATAEKATITASAAAAVKVVVASYADGRMTGVKTQTVALAAGSNDVTIEAAAGDKVMVWSTVTDGGMKAYCPAAIVK